jgi:hypothetical protein
MIWGKDVSWGKYIPETLVTQTAKEPGWIPELDLTIKN